VTGLTPNQVWFGVQDQGGPSQEELLDQVRDRQQKRAESNAKQWNKTATKLPSYVVGDRVLIRDKRPSRKGVAYPYQGRVSAIELEKTRLKVVYTSTGRLGEQPEEGHSEEFGRIFSPPRPAPVLRAPVLDVYLRNPSQDMVLEARRVLERLAPHVLQKALDCVEKDQTDEEEEDVGLGRMDIEEAAKDDVESDQSDEEEAAKDDVESDQSDEEEEVSKSNVESDQSDEEEVAKDNVEADQSNKEEEVTKDDVGSVQSEKEEAKRDVEPRQRNDVMPTLRPRRNRIQASREPAPAKSRGLLHWKSFQ